jgi:hypothetical protein
MPALHDRAAAAIIQAIEDIREPAPLLVRL